MDRLAVEPESIRQLRRRAERDGGAFWTSPDTLHVADPDLAQRFNQLNYPDLTLSDRWIDVLRRRRSAVVSWTELRTDWMQRLRKMTQSAAVESLHRGMAVRCEKALHRSTDLTWWAQQLCAETLTPWVIEGLSAADRGHLHRDVYDKAGQILTLATQPKPGNSWRSAWTQMRAGLVVRREIAGRAKGRRPRQHDLADVVVDLLPRLGLDRAVDSLTALLTAISGPPGSAVACLLYELARRPRWVARMARELESLPFKAMAESPAKLAPLTHRFVKESLRFWSLPLLMVREVHVDMELAGESLAAGQRVVLSPYFMHHDARQWSDPDTFDPDRWLRPEAASTAEAQPETASSARRGCPHSAPQPSCPHGGRHRYKPFGWAPRSCLGANLGMLQMMLLCHLLSTKYRLVVENLEGVQVVLDTVPRVCHFEGYLLPR